MEKTKKVLKLIGIYLLNYILWTVVFVLLFRTPLFKGMDVLMYRGVIFIFLTGLLAAGTMAVLMRFLKLIEIRDIILMFFLICCVNMTLFTLIPVTVERSVSVFMLSYMEQNDDRTYTREDVEEIFAQKYVKDYGAFEKRFNEQEVTGTIEKNADGTYSITPSGRRIVKMFRTVAEWFDTDKRLVYPNDY
ncbi:MAG: hypothetical protein IKN14_04400 [Clostridiales bacterium]|nr:hypothetical protein [Clostridiales bacterium]